MAADLAEYHLVQCSSGHLQNNIALSIRNPFERHNVGCYDWAVVTVL